MLNTTSSILDVFLPEDTSQYFIVQSWSKDETNICIILEEKDEPPLSEKERDKKIVSKGFHDITVTDFPIRGRRALLTFRRRYWQVEGQKKLLKRDIKLAFPGTQLAIEFANFLKETCGRNSDISFLYRDVAMPPDQRI